MQHPNSFRCNSYRLLHCTLEDLNLLCRCGETLARIVVKELKLSPRARCCSVFTAHLDIRGEKSIRTVEYR